jgi:DinB family
MQNPECNCIYGARSNSDKMKIYRQGAVGALLDIYEQAISEFKKVIEAIPDSALTITIDPQTTDENCTSIQTILTHVVNSGYGYATNIHNLKGHNMRRPDKIFHLTIKEYGEDLTNVFTYTETIFKEIKDNELEQFDNSLKIKTTWGQWYDIEQMTEHAIVHILRHKRQLDNIKRNTLK